MRDRSMRHYCTLFDRNYLLRGLALYRSLEQYATPFVLYVLCMDDTVHDLLKAMALPGVRLIRRADFEDPQLLAVKPTRTVAEYCWTCTPSLPLYVLEHDPDVDLITYLDADVLLFSSPEPIFDEFGAASILIVEHRFPPRFAHFTVNGRYNVEWLTFRRDANGMAALRWWRDKCIEWCFYRLEEDRMGDQKYLDSWPTRFSGVHVLQHVGAGLAPWNFTSYRIGECDGRPTVDGAPLIFYHFHGFRYRVDRRHVPMADMYLKDALLPEGIYRRYVSALEDAAVFARQFDADFRFGMEDAPAGQQAEIVANAPWTLPRWCRAAARKLLGL